VSDSQQECAEGQRRCVRVATWNVERPKPRGWLIPPAQRARMSAVDADIWVLTETHLQHAPSPDHEHHAFSPPHPERRPEHERWAAIWSRWPLTSITDPPPHRRGTVAAIADTPHGPLIVYATVIAWANEKMFDDGTPARMWEVHHHEAARQANEWAVLEQQHPGIPIVVAGDFNQDRDGSGYYGTAQGRGIVTAGLEKAGLVCITDFDAVARGELATQHLVDHICVSAALASTAVVSVVDRVDARGMRLSDHPTLIADLNL
jgi:endonuclease/exonuclease/phosphatase family metal-dependent hydrolase